LKESVRIAEDEIRDVDALVRYGGEKFLLLMPKTALAGATDAAERVRAAVERGDFLWSDQKLKVTVSAGVTSLAAGMTDDQLIRRVDELLYQAKRSGRNRVVAG